MRKKVAHTVENNFFLGFIGDIIVSTPCNLAFRDTHHLKQVHFLRELSFPQRWNFTLLPHVKKQASHFLLCTYARLLSELRPSSIVELYQFSCLAMLFGVTTVNSKPVS